MKVCYICNEYPEGPHGGIGTVTKLLAGELNEKGHTVKVIGVYSNTYPSPEKEIIGNIEVRRIKVNTGSRIATYLAYYRMRSQIKKWCRTNEIDIIESPDSYGLLSMFPAFQRPLVLRAHGNNTYFGDILGKAVSKKTRLYEQRLYRKATALCAVSEFTALKMKELLEVDKPIRVIYNGIDLGNKPSPATETEKVNGIQKRDNAIVFSGTLIRKKGIYELVQAMQILLDKGHDIRLIINGKDTINPDSGQSVRAELEEMIPAKYKSHFIFNGHVSREVLFQLYYQSQAAIFPSYAEAFAMAPLEAMATGIPTIFSTPCSGREIITDKVNGLLVDPSSADSIADAIAYITDNPDSAADMGLKGKQRIEELFTKEVMANHSLQFYEEIITAFHSR